MPPPVMKTPRSVDVEITAACNLRCAYCSHFSGPGDVKEDLPLAEWLAFFAELRRCAVMTVTLSGGEPFCRPDLKEIIEGIVENRMRFAILSNGTLIEPETASFLSRTGRCDYVQISIDGAIDVTHDAFRGRGNFARAIEGIRTLQRSQVPVCVRVTIHKRNVRELAEVARLLLDEIGLPSFSTNSASYMGLCRKNSSQTQLTAEERSLAMEEMLRLAERYPGRISASAGPLAEGRAWLEMEEARQGRRPAAKGGFLTGCNGPSRTLAVRADGAITPCLQLGHLVLGRINRDPLLPLWQTHPLLRTLRERSAIPLSSFAFCRGCEYTSFCTGNCPATAYTMTGEVNHPSPEGCLRLFLKEGGRLPRLTAEGTKDE